MIELRHVGTVRGWASFTGLIADPGWRSHCAFPCGWLASLVDEVGRHRA